MHDLTYFLNTKVDIVLRKLNEFSGRPGEREKWLKDHLLPLYLRKSGGYSVYYLLYLLTTHYFYFKSKNEKAAEDIYSVYKLLIEENETFWQLPNELQSLVAITKQHIPSFPQFSLFIQIGFVLRKPYISQDDEPFYLMDNPICKEKVFKVPMIRSSSWKGNLRWVGTKLLTDKIVADEIKEANIAIFERARLVRMFGNEKENVKKHLDKLLKLKFGEAVINRFEKYTIDKVYVDKNKNGRGRLNFYPTFFNKISLNIINPHDRETKTGTVPIQIEIVPEGTEGKFQVFYYPFDLAKKLYSTRSEQKEEALKEIEEDMHLLAEIIKETLLSYGFSAKKTSGYGVVEDNINFQVNNLPKKEGNFELFIKEMKDFVAKFWRENNGNQ